MGYNIEFYPYLYFFLHFDFRSVPESDPDPEQDPDPEFFQLSRIRIRGKKCRILIPGEKKNLLYVQEVVARFIQYLTIIRPRS